MVNVDNGVNVGGVDFLTVNNTVFDVTKDRWVSTVLWLRCRQFPAVMRQLMRRSCTLPICKHRSGVSLLSLIVQGVLIATPTAFLT